MGASSPRPKERHDKALGQALLERGKNETERASRDPPALG